MEFFTSNYWINFIIFFALFAKSLWFFYYFALYGFNNQYSKNEVPSGKIALIVPAYNEEEDKLRDTIVNAKKVKGVDKIIFVNDGSKNNVYDVMKSEEKGIKIVNLKHNVGKRHAQYAGMKHAKDADIFVFMDSDTILQENSILELLRPMSDPTVGGATACILVKNRNDNFLTKCLSAMYWTASNIWRQAPSNLGFLQVTNGQLSCYRATHIWKLMPEYLNQKFMGVQCTLSDDRFITHYIQTEFKQKIAYADTSIVHTYVPNTYRATYKMMLRWKLGSLREALLVTKKITKHPLLVMDVWWNHGVALMQTFVRVGIIIIAIFFPIILLYYIFIISLISLFFAFHMIIKNFKEIGYRIGYSIINEIFFSWIFVHAIIRIKNQGKWNTR